MSITPSISLVAYEARDGRVFVKVPDERARWILTDRCVVEVHCPQCRSVRGEPCRGVHDRYGSQTHYARRTLWQKERPNWRVGKRKPDQLTKKPRFKLVLQEVS